MTYCCSSFKQMPYTKRSEYFYQNSVWLIIIICSVVYVAPRWETIANFLKLHVPGCNHGAKEVLAKAKELQKNGTIIITFI